MDVVLQMGPGDDAALLGLVGFGAWRGFSGFKGGGTAVAKRLGCKSISWPGKEGSQPGNDLREKQFLDVVEEISLAAGLRAPNVCVLERESTINAFAAGITLADACVVVTRAAVEKLNAMSYKP